MKSSALMASALMALVSAIVLSAIVLACGAVPANAQPYSLTYVSGVGEDANPCYRTAPCKTFAGAYAKTTAGGTINCLDPGGFGAVTITQSLTIDCEQVFGSVLVSSTAGINISGSGIVVNLRGLRFNGILQTGNAGTTGINIIQAAAVYIKKSVIFGFQTSGIAFASGGTLVVNDTVIHDNGAGIVLSGGGNATLRNVVVHGNSGNGISITSGGVTIDHGTLAFNTGAGLNVNGSGVVAMIGNSTITGNATGVSVAAGTLYSFKQNQIARNTADGTPIAAFPGPGGPLQ